MQNIQKQRESIMSPTMQAAHSSVKMPQITPQSGSIPAAHTRQHNASISMYSYGK